MKTLRYENVRTYAWSERVQRVRHHLLIYFLICVCDLSILLLISHYTGHHSNRETVAHSLMWPTVLRERPWYICVAFTIKKKNSRMTLCLWRSRVSLFDFLSLANQLEPQRKPFTTEVSTSPIKNHKKWTAMHVLVHLWSEHYSSHYNVAPSLFSWMLFINEVLHIWILLSFYKNILNRLILKHFTETTK